MIRTSKIIAFALVVSCNTGCATSRTVAGPPSAESGEVEVTPVIRLARKSVDDYRHHYRGGALLDLLPPLAIAGALANSNADRWIRDKWQDDVRSETSDDIARIFVRAGDAAQNRVSIPLYSLTMLATGYSGIEGEDSPSATWAERSLRANVLGGPEAWALTYMLGSHRPRVGTSGWNPWNDNDGVSGHSFYGAVPFLTAAHLSDHAGWRYTLYALSVLPAYARVNVNQHYTSQAVMGWSVAWLATRTVARKELDGSSNEGGNFALVPMPDGAYLSINVRF